MADIATITLALKPVLGLVKFLPWALKKLPYNSPTARAVKITAQRYSSRFPAIRPALEAWILSDAFRSEVECLENGTPPGTDLNHIELFVTSTGLGLGTIPLETVRDVLVFFYSELRGQLLGSEQGSRILGAEMENLSREVIALRPASIASNLGSIPYRAPLEATFGSTALTEKDRKAETQLDIIKGLIDKRTAGTALELLSAIQGQVDNGDISVPLRFRFFINKGVCLMLEGKWDEAEVELGRAQTLEPTNPKALINLAHVLRFKGQLQDALRYLETVLRQDPTQSAANALRFACLHATGDKNQIAAILAVQPDLAEDPNCQYALACIAYDQEKLSEAEHYLRRHNEQDANYPEAWELLGRVIVIPAQRNLQDTTASPKWISEDLKARLEEAVSCFSRAEQLLTSTESRRELKFTLNNRGITRSMLGLDEYARQDFERALQIDPSLDEAKRNLGNLLLSTGKPAAAVRVFQQIASPAVKHDVVPLMAAALLDLQRPAEARSVLEPERDSGNERKQLFVKDILLAACQQLKDQNACVEIVTSLSSQTTNPEACRIIAEFYARDGDYEQAGAFARHAVEAAAGEGARRYRLLLADILYRARRFDEAADEYDLVGIPMDESPESRRRLIALFNSGRIGKALHVAQSVRNSRPAIADFSEVEALIFERTGDLDRAIALRRGLLAAAISPSHQTLRIAINHVRRDRRSDAAAMTMEVDLASIADNAESLRDAAMLRTELELPDALVFAYRFLQLVPEDADSHLFYVKTFLRREVIDKGLFQPDIAGVDCVVTLRHRGEKTDWTVVNGDGDITKNWLSIRHGLAKEILGKRVGERFHFHEGEPSEAEYEIEAIHSKYLRAFQDCMGRFNERFPTSYGLQRMDVDPKDLTNIAVMLDQQRERAEGILDLYRARQIPACSMARLFGKSDVEMFRSLAEDDRIKVLSYHGARDAIQGEETALSHAKNLILEASALVTLHSLGLLEKLATAFGTVWITQFARDALADTVRGTFPEKKTGRIFSDRPGHIQMIARTSQDVSKELEFYQQLLQFMQKCSVAAPTEQEGLQYFASVPTKELLGMEALSTVSAALDSHYLLVSDDLPLRVLTYNDQRLTSVGTLAVLRHLRARAVLSADEYHRAAQWLVEHNFSFVSVDSDDIIWVFRQNEWSPKPEVANFLRALNGPDCNAEDAIRVGLDVLYVLWNEPLPTATQQLSSDLVIQAVITRRDVPIVLRRLQAMNHQRSAIWTPAVKRIQGVIENSAQRLRSRA